MTEQKLLEIVKILNRERHVTFLQSKQNKRTFSGSIRINDNITYCLTIFFPDTFPLQLPEIRVNDCGERLAHMGADGKLCLLDESSVLLNLAMPDQILLDCFDLAYNLLLVDMKSDNYKKEILREFNSYWFASAKLYMYSAIEEKNYGYSEMPMFISGNIRVLASSLPEEKYLACNYLKAIDDDKAFSANCNVISLRKNSKPIVLKKLYKWSEVRKYILDNVSGSVKRAFQRFLNKTISGGMKYIVLSLPSEHGNILFGFRVNFRNKRREKIEKITNVKVEQVYIYRIDRKYMLQRSGMEEDISKKQILLLGCGSVGGYIANNLCQLGIGAIDLLDNDLFSKENVHRHFLGFDSLMCKSSHKAVLLKERLEQMYPYTDIDSLDYEDRSVEKFILKKDRLANYDIIISALGEPTLNLEINRILYEEKISTPFICGFNEPYGIGGHAVAVNIDQHSCLRCLYTDLMSDDLVPFRASLVEEGQHFKKNISGCSSAFVPYSCLDSQQTAILVARLAIEILKGEVEHNKIYSWIGKSDALVNAGFIPSAFYQFRKTNKSEGEVAIMTAKHCPICHKK